MSVESEFLFVSVWMVVWMVVWVVYSDVLSVESVADYYK